MVLRTLNYAHNNEIYGSMVSYLRMKDIDWRAATRSGVLPTRWRQAITG